LYWNKQSGFAMRLEHLFDADFIVVWSAYIDVDAPVSYSFAHGEGAITGTHLNGRAKWSNHPWRRPDGVWNPDIQGIITADDGANIRFAFRGLSVPIPGAEHRFSLVASATFQAEIGKYRWLNNVVGAVEAELVAGTPIRITLRAYACVNELAALPPIMSAP
jgi:hypothetical protein